jgi:hypothetical protein
MKNLLKTGSKPMVETIRPKTKKLPLWKIGRLVERFVSSDLPAFQRRLLRKSGVGFW